MGLGDSIRNALHATLGRAETQPDEIAGSSPALQIIAGLDSGYPESKHIRALQGFKEARETSGEDQIALAIDAVRSQGLLAESEHWHRRHALCTLAQELMRKRLPWDEASATLMLETLHAAVSDRHRICCWSWPLRAIVRSFEQTWSPGDLPPGMKIALSTTQRLLEARPYLDADDRALCRRVSTLIRGEDSSVPGGADPWSTALRQVHGSAPDDDTPVVEAILELAATARGTAPNKEFLASRTELLERPDAARLTGSLLVASAGAVTVSRAERQLLPDLGDLVRGLCWVASGADTLETARGLGMWAHLGWQKVPGHGPLSRKVAGAALQGLAELDTFGAPQLGRVRALLKQPTALAEADTAIDRAAERLGVARSEFEERVVPDYNLVAGERSAVLGEHTVVLTVGADLKAGLRFFNAKGEPIKTAPAALKRDHVQALKDLKADAKDITGMAAAQRLRLERLLLHTREWDYTVWRERYLDHGLVSVLARRLIWSVTEGGNTQLVIWSGDSLVDVGGACVTLSPTSRVSLWHPVDATAEQVMRWRRYTEDKGVLQPFKQAHREVYLLTDAEITTRVYSNRFAAHVLRQHQFAALARGRGWSYALQGAYDSADEQAHLPLPEFGLTATFWVERPWGDDEDWNDAGIFNHVLTDQVRFTGARAEDVPLADVPVRVLSEVLRDVDLFVGVASIGNDPAWQDAGENRRYDQYWSEYSFGDLGEAAKVRRDLLERLLPKLAISKVARLEGRWLIVDGGLRTYRIHLGSGNIQMEPNNQYLCIVPGRKTADADVFLPFEGDRVLSIILSKAMMLANDITITDATITRQIKQR